MKAILNDRPWNHDPKHFLANGTDTYLKSTVGQAGFSDADSACPMAARTWEAAHWSAQSAIVSSDTLVSGAHAAYVLSRPPGHDAFGDLAGGFCFLDNCAIAPDHLRSDGFRAIIIDVDVHQGNGTQGIPNTRNEVLMMSIHAEERGAGAGLFYNLNLPLARGTNDDDFLKTFETALARGCAFGTDAVVIVLGLEAGIDGPCKGLAITLQGFALIEGAIKRPKLPPMFVQKGGYLCDERGDTLTSTPSGHRGG